MVLDIDSGYDKQGSPLSERDSSYRRSHEMQGKRVEALCRRADCLRARPRVNPMKIRYNDASVSGRLERGPRWIQEVFA